MSSDNVIFMDIDGVLADFIGAFTKLGNQLHGTPAITTDEMPSWDGFPMDNKQVNATWEYIHKHNEWWGTLPKLVSYEMMSKLWNYSGLYYVTNRPAGTLQVTIDWIREGGGADPMVIVTKDKAKLAECMHPVWALDDSPANLWEYMKLPGLTPVAFHRRYNATVHGVKRVNTLEQFLSMVDGGLNGG